MEENKIECYKGSEKKMISLESVQAEMAQCLQMDNLSFLLGAGCSSNIVGESETGIPGMVELYTRFFEENPTFSIAGRELKGMFDENLEKMMEFLGAVDVVNQAKEFDPEIAHKTAVVRNFLRGQIIAGLDSCQVRDIYKGFYSRITQRTRKKPISIFTTNYDLFNEIALDELGFPYNDGFAGTYKRKFSPVSYNYMYVENMNLHRDVWERVSSFFNLIKLHGSITWVRENEQIWERDYKQIPEEDTVMIYPTPLKDRTTLMTPYSDLFRAMENRIVQKNSVLVVLGYSFSDDHINRVILNGLSLPSFRLIVFGKSANIDKLIDLNDTRVTVIRSDEKIHYFKNFVDQALPSVHPDVEEMLSMQPANQVIASFERDGTHE